MMKWLENVFAKKQSAPTVHANAVVHTPNPPQSSSEPKPRVNLATQPLESTPQVRSVATQTGFIALKQYSNNQVQAQWRAVRDKVNGTLIIFADIEPHSEMRTAEPNLQKVEAEAEPIVSPPDLAVSQGLLANFRPDPALLEPNVPPAVNFFSLSANGATSHLGVVPIKEPWRAPAHLNFGGWQEIDSNNVIIAHFKSWHDRFGAVPALISAQVIEFWLDTPITNPETAADLAIEMYSLCPEVVEDAPEVIASLANSILGANVWYFSWA